MHPNRRFAKQVCHSSGRVASAAVDEPLVTDRLIPLDQAAEKALHFRMCVDNRVEVFGLPNHYFAADDCLNAIFGDAVAGQDPLTGKSERDDLPSAGVV